MKIKQEAPIHDSVMLKELLLFYLPLGIYSMIMMSTHSVMNLGISRAANAKIGLAAFAVTMNIMNTFASPCFGARQMLVALAHDKKSLRVSKAVMIKITFLSLSLLSILAFTPIGEFVFVTLFNTPQNLMKDVKSAAVFALSLPFIYTLRAYSQGIIIVNKKTEYLTFTVIVRILFMIALAIILPKIKSLSGASIGMIIWTSGMALESVVNFLFSRKLYSNMPEKPLYVEGKEDLSTKTAFSFIWPLLIMSFLWTLALPMINSGLGHTSDPELSLATFQVSRNYIFIIIGFLENNLRQVSLMFGTSDKKIAYLKKFTLGASGIITLAVATLALTPIGDWGLVHVIGVSQDIARASKPVLIILIALPFTMAWSEYYTGLLMRLNNTKSISIGKVINIGLTILSVIAFSILLPQLGATVGALGMIIGFAVEMLFLKYVYHITLKFIEGPNF